jgi:hypothetical protein
MVFFCQTSGGADPLPQILLKHKRAKEALVLHARWVVQKKLKKKTAVQPFQNPVVESFVFLSNLISLLSLKKTQNVLKEKVGVLSK